MPRSPSPYYVRKNNTYRGKVATCFHCRLPQSLVLQGGEGTPLVFIEHYDVERYGDLPREREWHFNHGFAKQNQVRRIPSIVGEIQELCPGTETEPIPLAHKFPDGTALPRFRYYRW